MSDWKKDREIILYNILAAASFFSASKLQVGVAELLLYKMKSHSSFSERAKAPVSF